MAAPGSEAMFADLGHFTVKSMQVSTETISRLLFLSFQGTSLDAILLCLS